MAKPLLEVQNIAKMYGRQDVLKNISFQVAEGQKIALIGRNGAGKSTLLKILMGEIEADSGSFQMFDWTHVGVIRQNEVLPGGISTLAFLEESSGKPSWEVKKMGSKFGLHVDHLEKAPSELSGGYQMRIKLVAMFLKEPNLLFLDEPVNYLDLQTLLMLESVLADYRGSFILVAHDRTFLQNTCDFTYEIERAALTIYKGKVQEFLEWKAEQLEFVKRTNKKLSREMSHHQKFVDRFGAKANLASRAKNKVKHISRLRSQIVKINADLATTRITIPSPTVHAGPALRVTDLVIGYGDLVIADNITFTISRGEKIVIAGDNGRGKSTLLKTIVGQIELLDGYMKWWKHADVGYYDQLTSSSLKDNDKVISHLTDSARDGTSAEQILMMAGNFLFQGDDLDKPVSVLSGGERARLALAGILLRNHSVLILDEPTNHLDVETSEGLAIALKKYKGTVIFVSHARTFVSALADRVFEVRHGSVREYRGDYPMYVEYLAELAAVEADMIEESVSEEEAIRNKAKMERKEARMRVREIQRSLRRVDSEIEKYEQEKAEIMKYFFENPTDYAPPKAQRLEELKKELERLEREWLKLQDEIEAMSV
ncbi:ATP-binding cassette domain-containing protein [Candidatus Uhrbacteria bacterium]|jgi:ATP-binding cassette, subfamily F, member 3|nr:ATP-binding cassette domain-containing protein [Candidatus Uhrbacteria bacterium]